MDTLFKITNSKIKKYDYINVINIIIFKMLWVDNNYIDFWDFRTSQKSMVHRHQGLPWVDQICKDEVISSLLNNWCIATVTSFVFLFYFLHF